MKNSPQRQQGPEPDNAVELGLSRPDFARLQFSPVAPGERRNNANAQQEAQAGEGERADAVHTAGLGNEG